MILIQNGDRLCNKRSQILGAVTALFLTTSAFGQELSLLSGVYKSSEVDNTGTKGGKKTAIGFGGRYSDQLSQRLHWYGEGQITLRSYGKNASDIAPPNSTSLSLGGGVRHYFGKIGENFATYASVGGQYKSEKDGSFNGNSASTTEKNGLYYGAGFGIRLYLGSKFFCDLEAPLFESALFATETVTTETKTGATVTKTDVETKKTELFASTAGGPLGSAIVSLGMKL